MAQHVLWPICLHFDRMRSCLEEILPAGGQGRDGCWGLPARRDGESFLSGIRQEKRRICSELFHGTLWLDNAIRQLGAVAFSIKRLYKTKKILSSTVWGMCGLHFLLLRENQLSDHFFKVEQSCKLLVQKDDAHFHSYFSSILILLPTYEKKPPKPHCSCLGSGHVCMSKIHLENQEQLSKKLVRQFDYLRHIL